MEPIVEILADDILEFAEDLKEIKILDERGAVMLSGDNYQRFFEASYNGKFYFSYSMTDSVFIFYAISDCPYGPFTYQGRIFNPAAGRSFHHSICEIDNEWYLCYHDSNFSKGVNNSKRIKVTKIDYMENGKIVTIDPYGIRRVIE